jgi:hypothetical protein
MRTAITDTAQLAGLTLEGVHEVDMCLVLVFEGGTYAALSSTGADCMSVPELYQLDANPVREEMARKYREADVWGQAELDAWLAARALRTEGAKLVRAAEERRLYESLKRKYGDAS